MDRTLKAVEQQIAAMGCERFEIGVREPLLARMILRHWSAVELLKNMSWLKRENAQGSDIYVVPDEPTALVLLDDLILGKVKELEACGLAPCCVTETSPMNYQAWLKLADHPLDPKVLTTAAKSLAKRFHGDPSSATWKHFGRLAGFTNRKPKHVDEQGRAPFVKLWSASGKVTNVGLDIVREAEALLRWSQETQHAAVFQPNSHHHDPNQRFREGVAKLQAYYGAGFDASKADLRIAQRMTQEGYTPQEIAEAMRLESPEIETRKSGRVEAYVELTVKNARQEAAR